MPDAGELVRLVRLLIETEGCGCCQRPDHDVAIAALARLLGEPMSALTGDPDDD